MTFVQQAARIERLIRLIDSSNTGTAKELAKKMGVSRRTIFNDLDYLKGRGLQTVFYQNSKSYCFEKKRINITLF